MITRDMLLELMFATIFIWDLTMLLTGSLTGWSFGVAITYVVTYLIKAIYYLWQIGIATQAHAYQISTAEMALPYAEEILSERRRESVNSKPGYDLPTWMIVPVFRYLTKITIKYDERGQTYIIHPIWKRVFRRGRRNQMTTYIREENITVNNKPIDYYLEIERKYLLMEKTIQKELDGMWRLNMDNRNLRWRDWLIQLLSGGGETK